MNHTRPPQDYRNQYEPILYGWKMGADRREVEDGPTVAVSDLPRPSRQIAWACPRRR